jgi:hypothetical protein
VLLPIHDYAVTGSCATGTGLASASTYAPGSSGRGWGLGAGIGGRIGYQRPAVPPAAHDTWWGLRAGAGLDLDILYARVPTGIPDMTGALCARVKTDGAAVEYKGSSLLLAQATAFVGAELGLGKTGDSAAWRGVILGAAWAPAVNYLQPWVASGDFDASYLGTELTVDFVAWHPGPAPQEPGKRIALSMLFPVIFTASFGAVWY